MNTELHQPLQRSKSKVAHLTLTHGIFPLCGPLVGAGSTQEQPVQRQPDVELCQVNWDVKAVQPFLSHNSHWWLKALHAPCAWLSCLTINITFGKWNALALVQLLHPAASQGLSQVSQGKLSSLRQPNPWGNDAPTDCRKLWASESAWSRRNWDPVTPIFCLPFSLGNRGGESKIWPVLRGFNLETCLQGWTVTHLIGMNME